MAKLFDFSPRHLLVPGGGRLNKSSNFPRARKTFINAIAKVFAAVYRIGYWPMCGRAAFAVGYVRKW